MLFFGLTLATVFILGSPSALGDAPPLEWSATYTGSGLADGRGVAVNDGGVYVTGKTWPAGGYGNMFLLKYDLAGNSVWDRTWGGSNHDEGWKVGLSGAHVYVAGDTKSYAYDPVGGVEPDAVSVKWTTGGELDTSQSPDGWWTRFSGDAGYYGYDRAHDLALDGSGNLHVTGYSERGYINAWAYVEQYDPSAVKQWHQHYGFSGAQRQAVNNAVVLSGGNLYTAGQQTPDGSYQQVLALKYSSDGAPVWAYEWGDSDRHEQMIDVAVSGDDIYLTGFVGSSDDPNGRDLLLLKLHDDGTSVSFVDSTVFSGSSDDIGWGIVEVDGQIYIVGSTDVGGNTDALFLAYDSDLNPLWDTSWGGLDDDFANDIAFHDGMFYLSGTLGDEAFVNAYVPEPGTLAMLTLAGMFLARRRR